jgi:hypothetical protein
LEIEDWKVRKEAYNHNNIIIMTRKTATTAKK